jgi:hypothetical protein
MVVTVLFVWSLQVSVGCVSVLLLLCFDMLYCIIYTLRSLCLFLPCHYPNCQLRTLRTPLGSFRIRLVRAPWRHPWLSLSFELFGLVKQAYILIQAERSCRHWKCPNCRARRFSVHGYRHIQSQSHRISATCSHRVSPAPLAWSNIGYYRSSIWS